MRLKRIAHYDVTSLLGEGGMGQVSQATDTQLGRQVALKILPDAFADDPDRLARFTREAQILASLNHPNIAAIYGIEESEGTRALVLELVEGPTLADRISQGPIPLDEALPIAKQIAEALEAAHEQGVIHRDLKPANIKVKADGTVKVLDFGLAKALAGDAQGPDLSQSPTMTASMGGTRDGVILGTAAYMSPEQARGQTLDKRTDIWSFGCVLYEMLTGRAAFRGETLSDTIANVIEPEPAWAALPTDLPAVFAHALRRCVRKNPRQRVHDVADVRLAMEEAFETPAGRTSESSAAPQLRVWQRPAAVALLALCAAVAASLAIWTVMRPSEPVTQLTTRSTINLPARVQHDTSNGKKIAISPDGLTLAYTGFIGNRAERQLYVRRADELDAVPIPGIDDPLNPFFSPDGEALGFFDRRVLKKVSLGGGPVETIGEIPDGVAQVTGATWTSNDTIIFGARNSGLMQVSSAGGAPGPFLELEDGEVFHRSAELLPGERWVLFTVRLASQGDTIAVHSLETGERRLLVQGSDAHFLPTGHLVFARARKRGHRIKTYRRSWLSACRHAGIAGRIPHDFRRTAVRNLERAGVPRSVAMQMTGHLTESVYRRYDIVSDADLTAAAKQLNAAFVRGA